MNSVSIYSAINYAAELAPTLEKPTPFIKWAEDIASILAHIYSADYDTVTEDLIEACKEEQGYVTEDE